MLFFYKERKRMQKTFRSFIKNGKERKERPILLKRTEKNAAFFNKEWKRTQKHCAFLKRTDAQPCLSVSCTIEFRRGYVRDVMRDITITGSVQAEKTVEQMSLQQH